MVIIDRRRPTTTTVNIRIVVKLENAFPKQVQFIDVIVFLQQSNSAVMCYKEAIAILALLVIP